MKYADLLIAEYERIGHHVRACLQHGITKRSANTAYRVFLNADHPVTDPLFPVELPDELYDLFSWHNGGGELVPYHEFMSFDEALESWDLASEMAEDSIMYENGNAVFADTSPFPILNFNNSTFIVMDVGERSTTRGSIGVLMANGCESVRNEFANLSRFFQAHLECCKRGTYYAGEHGLDFDDRQEVLDRFRSGNVLTANGAQLGL